MEVLSAVAAQMSQRDIEIERLKSQIERVVES